MNKLLGTDFDRLKKSKVFWAGIAFMLLFGAVLVLNQYREKRLYGYEAALDTVFFAYAILILFLSAAFCSLFLGTEYSDGTIRNKLVVGHPRTALYFSNLVTNIAACVLLCLAFLLPACALGIPLLGPLKAPPLQIALVLLGSFLMVCALCSILTVVGMLCQNKAAVAVLCVLGVVALLVAAAVVQAKLDAPEFYDGYVFTDSMGNMTSERIANPEYLRGTARSVYECLYDLLPTGQALQYSSMTAVRLWQMPLYSLAILAASTGAGLFAFQRKDIK